MTPLCPTCGARFRGEAECGRCGTDLRALAAVILAAREAREEARRSLLQEAGETALAHVDRSLSLHRTARGLRLRALALIACGRLREGVRLAASLVEEHPEPAGKNSPGPASPG